MSANPVVFSPIGRTKAITTAGYTPFVYFDVFAYAFDPTTGRTFVGGYFDALEGVSRAHIGAYDANGMLSEWQASVDGLVETMVVDGSRLYIGGDFDMVNGITRNGFAMLDTSSGAVLSFDGFPFLDDLGLTYTGPYDNGVYQPAKISHIAVDTANNKLHITGQISRVLQEYVEYSFNTYVQNHLVVNKTSGMYLYHILGNNNDGDTVDGVIQKTVVSGGSVYCVGPFNELTLGTGGTTYFPFQFGAYNSSTGAINTSLLPLFGGAGPYTDLGRTYDVAVLGGVAYVVGSFTQVNGASKSYMAGINVSSGAVTGFSISLGGTSPYIDSVRTDGTYLYILGNFTTVNGVTMNNFAALDTSGNLVSTKRLNLTTNPPWFRLRTGQNLQNIPNGIMEYDYSNRIKVWDTRYQSPRN